MAEVVEGLDCTLCSCPTLCLFSTSFSTKAAMTCTAARGRVVAAARNSHLGAEQRAGWRAPGSRTAEGDALAQSRVQGAQSRPVGTWRESTSTCGGRRVLSLWTPAAGGGPCDKQRRWLATEECTLADCPSTAPAHGRALQRAAHRLRASAVPRSAGVGGCDGQDHFDAG